MSQRLLVLEQWNEYSRMVLRPDAPLVQRVELRRASESRPCVSQSWEQALVSAQVEINRCVFEMNRPGALETDFWYAPEPDLAYIREHVDAAIEALEESQDLMPGAQRRLFRRKVRKLRCRANGTKKTAS